MWKWAVLAVAGFMLAGLAAPAVTVAQEDGELTKLLIQSYDLLAEGKLETAKKLYEEILTKHPDNPLALNNLAALLVKQGNIEQALEYLEKALPRARGYKVKVNQVCDVNRICMAFRPLQAVYGDVELEPLIRLNLEMIKAQTAAGPK